MSRLPCPRDDARADSPAREGGLRPQPPPKASRPPNPSGALRSAALLTASWLLFSLCVGPTLCDPADGSPPGSSAHGTSRGRTLSGLPCPAPGGLPDPPGLNWHLLHCGRILTAEPPGKSSRWRLVIKPSLSLVLKKPCIVVHFSMYILLEPC